MPTDNLRPNESIWLVSPEPSDERFALTLQVEPSDIDELGHVNNIVYLRWVVKVAVAHWRAEATADQQAAIAWVVVRHEIDYKHSAKLGDAIIARTWVGEAGAQKFQRHTEILRARDHRLLASALTIWCPISRVSGRPIIVDDEVRRRFSVPTLDGDKKV